MEKNFMLRSCVQWMRWHIINATWSTMAAHTSYAHLLINESVLNWGRDMNNYTTKRAEINKFYCPWSRYLTMTTLSPGISVAGHLLDYINKSTKHPLWFLNFGRKLTIVGGLICNLSVSTQEKEPNGLSRLPQKKSQRMLPMDSDASFHTTRLLATHDRAKERLWFSCLR